MLVVVSAVISGCTLETSGNGKLDGYWHLMEVDTISSGGKCDMSQRRVFWGIQAKIINISDRDNTSCDFSFRFEETNSMLRLYAPFVHDRSVGDTAVDDATLLAPFGLDSLEQGFKIEMLKSGTMRLATEKLKLHFKKM